jgi:hypothetical protein
MYYKFKYELPELKSDVINVLEKYDRDMHKTIYSFFAAVQNHEMVSLGAMKRTFGTLWIGNKDSASMLYAEPSSWRDTHNERRKRGINTVINVFNAFKDNPGFPIVINKPYSIKLSNTITLTGTWEIVREVDNKIQLIDFKVEDKLHNRIHIDKDIEITAACMAFDKIFDTKIDSVVYYGLDKNKAHVTNRNEDDFKVLTHTVTCVAKAIHNKLFYACPSNKCYSCMYKSVCSKSLNIENM